jgi:putative nucleotidyltransferase with HDIG domain
MPVMARLGDGLETLVNSPVDIGEESRLRILLVDDEEPIRDLLAEYLTLIEKHQTVTAGGGEEALQLFKAGEFDCAFLDLKMPGMNGVELLARLKEIEPTLPVVIMTGYPSLDVAIDTMRQGASDFLIKPINPKQVKLTLERVVREHRLLSENLRLSERLRNQQKIEQLNRELESKVREQQIINKISEAVDRLQSSEAIYQGMADLACQHLEAQMAVVMLMDRENKDLMVIAGHGLDNSLLGQPAARVGQWVVGRVAAEGLMEVGENREERPVAPSLRDIKQFLCLPIKLRGRVFGVLLVADKKDGQPFQSSDIFLANFLLDKVALAVENTALYESMVSNLHSTLSALVGAMEAKDSYTRQHSWRVTNLSVATAKLMGLGSEALESLRFAAYLHDIGKIGIKDNILSKNGRLTAAEYEEIKRHPVIGEAIIRDLNLSPDETGVIRYHHERWDGKGYPDGLGGEEIPLLARVVAVADAYDAMTSDRHYRQARDRQNAIDELLRCSGSQFDPQVVSSFVEMLTKPVQLKETAQQATQIWVGNR